MKRSTKTIAGVAVIALSWLVGIGTANAIIVRGHVDPLFGGSGAEAGMYWTALIEFQDVDNSCVATDGIHVCTPDAGSLSITGTLQEQSPLGPLVPVDFLFSAADPTITVNVVGGVITGIQTGIVGPTDFTSVSPPAIQGFAWVDFEFGSAFDFDSPSAAQLLFQICPPVTSDFRTLSSFYCDPVSAVCEPDLTKADTSNTATVRIEQIPEPGMLWLVAAAISAGWLARRRALRR